MVGRDDIKYIKRFSETRLSRSNFDELIAEIRSNGFLAMSTPFDEPSVEIIEDQALDIIKIASCSFTDWPLLERIASTDRPIIASTAGASLEDIDRVTSFLSHRDKEFAILHCVGEYPTADDKLHVGQIDVLKARYPGVRIGFSTHEDPANTDIVKLAIAKGAQIFEKHVGVATDDCPLNAYSANPEQIRRWLEAAQYALKVCGESTVRLPANPSEASVLRSLRRGVFLKRSVAAGDFISNDDVYFAFPPQDGQITSNDWSKYAQTRATMAIAKDQALSFANATISNARAQALEAAQLVKKLLSDSRITVPGGANLELSHHYGIQRFYGVGLTMISVVNRGYC
jgi:sialic acid synthase SpsE